MCAEAQVSRRGSVWQSAAFGTLRPQVQILSPRFILRPIGQAAKTAPSHGANPGSIPGLVIVRKSSPLPLFVYMLVQHSWQCNSFVMSRSSVRVRSRAQIISLKELSPFCDSSFLYLYFCSVSPDPFKVIEYSVFFKEDMHHYIIVIKQHPCSILISLNSLRKDTLFS